MPSKFEGWIVTNYTATLLSVGGQCRPGMAKFTAPQGSALKALAEIRLAENRIILN
jgi:hypothetical protein